ncbi:MAG: hypothetical protein IT453_15880 [Planctomycetes bacterium]|nr:hypothetical protein [Planctomycetota bacterium]
MNAHDAEHEKLLEDLISGSKPPDAASERRIASCAECARIWKELRDLEHHLHGAAGEQDAILRDALASPDRVQAEALVRDFVARVQPARRPKPRWVVLTSMLAVAAAVIVAVTLWRTDEPQALESVELHGTDHLRITTRGPVGDTLEWAYTSEVAADFEVIVRDADDPSIVIGEPKLLNTNKCTWTAEELKTWPARVRIDVTSRLFGQDGETATYEGPRE